MQKIKTFALRTNEEVPAFELKLNTDIAPIEVSLSPEIAGQLALALVQCGGQSGVAALAQVGAPFVVQHVSFRLYNGSLVLLQELQGGMALYSSIDRNELLGLRDEIDRLLEGHSPPSMQ
ncbi:viron-encapsulated RNA polymerase [Acidovorax phage AP1]|nr:viron-encapsulated RNA polymerase [Acidovorax phage AP1]